MCLGKTSKIECKLKKNLLHDIVVVTLFFLFTTSFSRDLQLFIIFLRFSREEQKKKMLFATNKKNESFPHEVVVWKIQEKIKITKSDALVSSGGNGVGLDERWWWMIGWWMRFNLVLGFSFVWWSILFSWATLTEERLVPFYWTFLPFVHQMSNN